METDWDGPNRPPGMAKKTERAARNHKGDRVKCNGLSNSKKMQLAAKNYIKTWSQAKTLCHILSITIFARKQSLSQAFACQQENKTIICSIECALITVPIT